MVEKADAAMAAATDPILDIADILSTINLLSTDKREHQCKQLHSSSH